ncbi:MAG: M50 family metallopeptidase [Deltaproteobacteria bacterium]|nr:M50 family metallopeptidase [Deltaproteobacteria bacterium]
MNVLVAIFALGTLVALHEAGHFLAARALGMTVLRFSVGFGRAVAAYTSKRTGITYQLGVVPLGGFVQVKGMNPFEEGAAEDPRSFRNRPAWRRALVVAAGPAANVVVAWAVIFGLYLKGQPIVLDEPRIGQVTVNGPADRAGIEPGDTVVTLDGDTVSSWADVVTRIHARPGKEIALELMRDGKTRTAKVKAANVRNKGLIGVGPTTRLVRLGPLDAAREAALRCVDVTAGTVRALAGLFSGAPSDVEPVGPVRIVSIAADTLRTGATTFFALVSYLSLMLFMFNLFPVPALDGGRLAFLFAELVARRPLNRKFEAWANLGGFALVMGLLVVVTVKEVFFG